MATKRKEIIRLLREGVSQADICRALHCSKRDVSATARMLKDTGITGEALADLTEDDVRQLACHRDPAPTVYIEPDLERIARELKRPGVTRKLLWYEYGNTVTDSGAKLYSYQQFCKLIDRHLSQTGAVMHLRHTPGRTLFVDWAGDTLAIKDRVTGTTSKVYLFVACLPYSGYFYTEGFIDVKQTSWLDGHMNAFTFFGGVPQILVPDNCATATDRSPIYVTVINSAYYEFAEHYQTAIVPTRVRRPKDKAMVEAAVGLVERWICAPLRDQVFFSLSELNEVIWAKLSAILAQPFQVREGSRESVFFAEERAALKPVAPVRFDLPQWRHAKVAHDYHVQIDYMRYSVPYRLIKETLDVRLTSKQVELFKRGELVAVHQRLYGRKGQCSTATEHMPPNHQYHLSSYSPERFRRWATSVGSACEIVIESVLASRPIIEQAFVPCANILGLSRGGRSELLEAACARFNEFGVLASYTQIRHQMEAIRKSRETVIAPDTGSPGAVEEPAGDDTLGRTRGAGYYSRQIAGE